jgi:hypothetical protein
MNTRRCPSRRLCPLWLSAAAIAVPSLCAADDGCSLGSHIEQLPCDGTASALLIDEAYDVIISETITELPISSRKIAQDSYSHLFCAGQIPCDTPDASFDFAYSEEIKQTYNVGSSLSITAAPGFAIRLVAKIEGTLTWDGHYSREETQTIARTAHFTLHPCQKLTVTATQNTRLSQGTIDAADEVWTWEFVGGPCDGKVVKTYCNRTSTDGSASKTAGVDISDILETCPPGSCYCIGEGQ